MSSDGHHLPPEILTLILTQLPVKSILRCRCVCKTWYSLISSPNFISDHQTLTLTQSTSNRVLVHRTDLSTDLRNCKFSSHDESFVESHEHDELPESLRGLSVQILGNCNGLVCLHVTKYVTKWGLGDEAHRFLIWNPSIRKLVELPSPSPSSSSANITYVSGFGFDPDGSDYKVLRFAVLDSGEINITDLVLVQSEIFDMRMGVWRSLSLTMLPCLIYELNSYLHLNGTLHWIGAKYDYLDPCTLLCFNLSREVFVQMDMPIGLEFEDPDNYDKCTNLLPINGFLSVALLSKHWHVDVHRHCWVWSMKEYGVTETWTKLFHIELTCDLNTWPRLVRCWENGEVLILDQDGIVNVDSALVLYSPESRESKVLLSATHLLDLCSYTESLVLL